MVCFVVVRTGSEVHSPNPEPQTLKLNPKPTKSSNGKPTDHGCCGLCSQRHQRTVLEASYTGVFGFPLESQLSVSLLGGSWAVMRVPPKVTLKGSIGIL